MEEQATVMQVGSGEALVRAQRQNSCGHCSANSSCGTSVLSRHVGQRSLEMWVVDPIGVKTGDQVTLRLDEGGVLRGSLAVYLLPLILFIASAVLGESTSARMHWEGEWATLVFGVAGFALSLLWLRRYNQRIRGDARFRPVIVERQSNVITFSRTEPKL